MLRRRKRDKSLAESAALIDESTPVDTPLNDDGLLEEGAREAIAQINGFENIGPDEFATIETVFGREFGPEAGRAPEGGSDD